MDRGDDMTDERRIVVVLDVRGDDGLEYEWSFVLPRATETPTEAIDFALQECDEEILGLASVRSEQGR